MCGDTLPAASGVWEGLSRSGPVVAREAPAPVLTALVARSV